VDYLIFSVEDDKDISHLINVTLSKQGYTVKSFFDSKSFLNAMKFEKPNLILLDIMLPEINGLDILKQLREDKANDSVDIIIVSARSMIMDKVDGFELGADDYIGKPFNILELIARVNAKARRYMKSREMKIGDLIIDLDRRTCFLNNIQISLTQKEFDILAMLFESQGKAVSREDILNQIWGRGIVYETRTVDMHIKALRQKLGDQDGNFIVTVHGVGYMINI
jgi:two-component system alkaline phosphatase synthesis response regulator PhoP